jgi:hypothetical protein
VEPVGEPSLEGNGRQGGKTARRPVAPSRVTVPPEEQNDRKAQ